MLIYFSFIFSLYFIFILILLYGWSKNEAEMRITDYSIIPLVSVIVAIRNEEKHILRLLDCLSKQTLSYLQFEVIIIDDQSGDNTIGIIKKFRNDSDLKIKVINSEYDKKCLSSPKKHALSQGINNSKGEIIVTTDGDCWFGEEWLESMIMPFSEKKVQFISGPVVFDDHSNLTNKVQILEFASLIGSGAALINLKYPLMCNGANLAFRKSAFHQVKGYEGNIELASGDDIFLMQKIHKNYDNAIAFVKNDKAIAWTSPPPGIREFISQRRRWASKWNSNLLSWSWFLPIFLFVFYLSLIAAIIAFLMDPSQYSLVLVFIFVKYLLDFLFFQSVFDFCKKKLSVLVFLLVELIYPLYVIFIGIYTQFGNYQWKGRKYKI